VWALVRATHALPSVAVSVFVTATAVAAGVGGRSALLGAAVLVGQASIGWANDYLDAPRDAQVGRTDKPIAAGDIGRGTVGLAAAVALAADVPLSLAVGWRPGASHLVAVGSAWMYDVRLKETVASALPYAVSFGLVPLIVSSALPGSPLPRASIVAAAAACGVAAHFANTVGDADDDAVTGVRGLPQRLGPAGSIVVASSFIAVAAVLLVAATAGATLAIVAAALDVPAAVVVTAATLRRARGARRSDGGRQLAFQLVIAAVAVLVTAFVVSGGHRLTAG
jgi:4-hydroxybenzoate polyprenyltransferase